MKPMIAALMVVLDIVAVSLFPDPMKTPVAILFLGFMFVFATDNNNDP
jgi:hypothetical protein